AHLATFFGFSSTDVCFDGIEFSDTTKRFLRHWRFVRDLKIVELPAHVRPTGRFLYASGFINRIEPRVRIGLQHASEMAEMCFRMFPFAVRRVSEPHRRG